MSFVCKSVNTVIRAHRGIIFKYRSTANNASISNFNVCKHFFSSNNVDETFKMAVTQVAGLRSEPGNEVKLKLYALYKQATAGPCNVDKPGMFDVVAKYKWEAWSKLGNKSKDESMQEYINLVESLIKSIGLVESETRNEKDTKPSTSTPEGMVITNKQGILTVRLNRPEKKNALLASMYQEFIKTFNDAAKDDNVKMVVLTGTGDYFSSGNDLIKGLGSSIVHSVRTSTSNSAPNFQIKSTDVAKLAKESETLLENFVNAFIDFPKPLLAVVNGPAFGIMVTTLALCDNVICSDKATFQTPFLSTAQTPEGCSTYTFPRIMGTAKANAMLLFNQALTAQEALQCGFVSKVIPHDQLDSYLDSLLYGEKGLLSSGSTITWRLGKPLIRTEEEKAILRKVNKAECVKLGESWLSPDFTQAMMKFFTRKK